MKSSSSADKIRIKRRAILGGLISVGITLLTFPIAWLGPEPEHEEETASMKPLIWVTKPALSIMESTKMDRAIDQIPQPASFILLLVLCTSLNFLIGASFGFAGAIIRLPKR